MRILSYLLLVLIVQLASCNPIKISENENKGVSQVLSTYGGQCAYSINWKVSTETGKQKSFKLELSQSPFIDQSPEIRDLFAPGVAYAFYKHLVEETKHYSHIKVVLETKDGSKHDYEYEVGELETVKQKMAIAEKIAALIKAKQFQEIKHFLNDSSYYKYDKDELIQNIIGAESEFGNAVEFIPLGYSISRVEGHINLHVVGQITRDKQTNSFSVDVDINDEQNRATRINYTF